MYLLFFIKEKDIVNVSVKGYMRKEETEETARIERGGSKSVTHFRCLVQSSVQGGYV